MERLKNWVFTLANPTPLEEDLLQEMVGGQHIRYMVYGREEGELNGGRHLQGYLELHSSKSASMVRRIVGIERIWLEGRTGTQANAIAYCKKDGDWWEQGVKIMRWDEAQSNHAAMQNEPMDRRMGTAKNKALMFMDLVRQGKFEEIVNHPDASHMVLKHCMDAAKIVETPRDKDSNVRVRWYWGPTGTGKTRRAIWEAEQTGEKVYIKASNSKWFCGYDSHKCVIFDDLRSSWFEFAFLLKLLDRTPFQVEVKGGSRQWKPTDIWVTSPYPPKEMYKKMQEGDEYDLIDQLLRRIHVICHMPMNALGFCWEPPKRETPLEEVEDLATEPCTPTSQ